MFTPKKFTHVLLAIVSALFLFSLLLMPVAAQEPVTIRVLTSSGNELSSEDIAAFEAANPDIKIELIENSDFLFDLALSTGDMPDIIRVSSSQIPGLVAKGQVLDLTDYFQTSELVRLDDIASAADYFKFDDRYYGLPKDWSPDFTLWLWKPAFEAAGLPIPSTTEPLTYAELAELAQKLTVRDGDTITQHGILFPNYLMTITQILIQRGTSMFNEDYSELQLTDNPMAMEVVKYFYDNTLLGGFNIDWKEMDQMWTEGENGFPPITQWGYWYGGSVTLESSKREKLVMLPAPTWDHKLPRVDTTGGPIGMAISATSAHPDEAYRFFEWYIVGELGIARAKSGWGAPPLVSMFEQLPQADAFDQQRLAVLQGELAYSNWQLPIYPYLVTQKAFLDSWMANMPKAMAGEIDFETFASNLQEEVNLSILNEQLGG